MASPTASRKPPPPGKRGPYAKSSETRERILGAALEVSGEVGIHRASVAGIAERAGVAVGNLHYHFGSREDLLRELLETVQEKLLDEMRQAIADTRDGLAMEEAALRTYLSFLRRNAAYVRLSEEARLLEPELYRESITTWLGLFREAIEAGIARGEIRAMDPTEIGVLAHLLLGARYFLDQMMEGVDGNPYPGDDAVVAAYLKLVRRGLEKESA